MPIPLFLVLLYHQLIMNIGRSDAKNAMTYTTSNSICGIMTAFESIVLAFSPIARHTTFDISSEITSLPEITSDVSKNIAIPTS